MLYYVFIYDIFELQVDIYPLEWNRMKINNSGTNIIIKFRRLYEIQIINRLFDLFDDPLEIIGDPKSGHDRPSEKLTPTRLLRKPGRRRRRRRGVISFFSLRRATI